MSRKNRYAISFSEAITEYLYVMTAAKRSKHTISEYSIAYRYFQQTIGDKYLHEIGKPDVIRFMHEMSTSNIPQTGVVPKPKRKRSAKTIRNYHTVLSALWTWALEEGYVDEHVLRQVKAPKGEERAIVPFNVEKIVAIVEACEYSKPWHNKPLTKNEKPTGTRNKAIVLMLLDTGVRNAELAEKRCPAAP